jgi:16S rRNA (uracil1498-N3)-methyltransferase
MRAPRVYQSVLLEPHANLRLDEKASHHLARVLRCGVGDKLVLFNGYGGEYHATITHINKKNVTVEISHFLPREAESSMHLVLAQSLARGEKMDFIVQKAVELGIQTIFPLITERGSVRLESSREEKRLQHWRSIIISACEQCGRNHIPEITAPQAFSPWLEHNVTDLSFILTPHVPDELPSNKFAPEKSITIMIGPEGGFSEHEIMLAVRKGVLPLRLGPRILRTETASIAAISILQARFGDLI